MLKRSKLLVAFLVVTVVCASIGFAAVSDTLSVSGTLGFDASDTNTELVNQVDEKVYFVQDGTSADKEGATATVSADATVSPAPEAGKAGYNDHLTIAIADTVLKKQGDTVVVSAVVKNENTSTVSLAIDGAKTWNDKYGEYITVTVSGATSVGANTTATVTFTFEVVKVPSTTINATDMSFTVTATTND